jgi:hypothetical protein
MFAAAQISVLSESHPPTNYIVMNSIASVLFIGFSLKRYSLFTIPRHPAGGSFLNLPVWPVVVERVDKPNILGNVPVSFSLFQMARLAA